MSKVLVTGGNGQMGQTLKSIVSEFPAFQFVFLSSQELDVTRAESCHRAFVKYNPDYCFNFAAYTNVEKAEEEEENVFEVNAEGCRNLSKSCLEFGVVLVHLSTDFVFDGEKESPYLVTDQPNPINVYGASKLQGEVYIQELLTRYFIVRTSWIYSEYGNNFRNTMLKLSQSKDVVKVVNDQIGCPTAAWEVCGFILKLIETKALYGLYHFSGNRVCSWFDFAVSIFKEEEINIAVEPVASVDYVTKAKRPKYSVLG